MKSPVIRLLDLVWKEAGGATPHSWERLNHAMYKALRLCIGAGFKFKLGDFEHIGSNYRSGYWLGSEVEWHYTMAVAEDNMSAMLSYEAWKKRPPFIADDVDYESTHHEFAHKSSGSKRGRLAVGFRFPWKGKRVTVTSFAEDGQSLTACSYTTIERDGGYSTQKIEKRFTITRQDIITERAEKKERTVLTKQLVDLGEKLGDTKIVLDGLGVKTRAEYDALPLAKIKAYLAKQSQ